MKIVLISGLSGSGKSVALKLLEDSGFYCVDNLPLELLPDLVRLHEERGGSEKLGISIDIRSRFRLQAAHEQIAALRQAGHRLDILFLEADQAVLLRRFSETRRSHPLSHNGTGLTEALEHERAWLMPLREAAYCIDTSHSNTSQLRSRLRQWLQIDREGLLVSIQSFGFKYGAPTDADFVFDVRSLPNPYYIDGLREQTGRDEDVRRYLAAQPEAGEMLADIETFILRRLPKLQQESRSYVTIAIGCTGGKHRSVYLAEELARSLQADYQVLLRHRQLDA